MNHDPMSRATPLGAQSDAQHGVGALLRASRQRCGEDLEEVAHMLRIRPRQLEAIEEGRFYELPGTTYALGFVRAYAEHLGLDSDEVVRRFKDEVGSKGKTPRTDLVFPEPLAEGGVPKGAVIFLGMVIAVFAYGGWYLNSVDNDFFKRWVAPLPERLAELLPENIRPGGDEAVTATETETALGEAGSEQAGQDAAVEKVSATTETADAPGTETKVEETGAVTSETSAEAEASGQAANAPAADPSGAAVADAQAAANATDTPSGDASSADTAAGSNDAPSGEALSGAEPSTTEAEREAGSSPIETSTASAATVAGGPGPRTATATVTPVQETPLAAPERTAVERTTPEETRTEETRQPAADSTAPAASEGTETETAATSDADASQQEATQQAYVFVPDVDGGGPAAATDAARVVLVATGDSWIEVLNGATGARVASRLLHAGERYSVPDQDGLTLVTGNAGGLNIVVDGKSIAPVGKSGEVVRNVSLDPEKLLAR